MVKSKKITIYIKFKALSSNTCANAQSFTYINLKLK